MTLVSLGTQTEPSDTQRISEFHHSVPDPEQGRYCKPCQAWLPVKNFPSGTRRHCCNLCRWERFGKLSKRKHMANGENKLLFVYWIKAYSDSRTFSPVWEDIHTEMRSSNTARVNISQKEIRQLVRCMIDTFNITSTMCNMYQDLAELGKRTALVPINPTEMVSLGNCLLVPSTAKRQLLKAFRLNEIEGYSQALSIAEAQANVVFRPSPEQLCAMQETLGSKDKTLLPEI